MPRQMSLRLSMGCSSNRRNETGSSFARRFEVADVRAVRARSA
jgi:hypothetical protein